MSDTIKIRKGSYLMTDEWRMKEYGSWEDHNQAPDHVCAILERENDGTSRWMELTHMEAEELLKSARFQSTAGWDGWEDPLDGPRYVNCVKGYINRITKAMLQKGWIQSPIL